MGARKAPNRTNSKAFQVRITEEMDAKVELLVKRLEDTGELNPKDQPWSKNAVVYYYLLSLLDLPLDEQVQRVLGHRDDRLEQIKRRNKGGGDQEKPKPRGRALPGSTFDAKRKLERKAEPALEPGIPLGVS